MKADADLDALMSEIYQLSDKLSDLDEVVSTERLTIITLDALLAKQHSIVKFRQLAILI